jgi:mono/diheme cytochrome c family protein
MPTIASAPALRPRGRGRGLALAAILAAAATLTACSEEPRPAGPNAERGRQIYLSQCIACHDANPAVAGPLGSPVKGSSRELLEAKVLKGTYPPGYTPKRTTNLMPPLPSLAPEISHLAAFLK